MVKKQKPITLNPTATRIFRRLIFEREQLDKQLHLLAAGAGIEGQYWWEATSDGLVVLHRGAQAVMGAAPEESKGRADAAA